MFQQGYNPFAVPQAPVGIEPTQFNLPAPKPKGGMFGGADWKSAIAAAIAGFSAGGGNPAGQMALQQLHGNRMQKQRQQLEEQQYQRQRTDGLADYEERQKIEARYSPPPQPTQTDRYIAEMMDPNTDPERKKMLSQVLFPPVMGVVNGVPSMIDRASMFGSAQGGPVGKLTPIEDEGGPSPLGSGGFPGSF